MESHPKTITNRKYLKTETLKIRSFEILPTSFGSVRSQIYRWVSIDFDTVFSAPMVLVVDFEWSQTGNYFLPRTHSSA